MDRSLKMFQFKSDLKEIISIALLMFDNFFSKKIIKNWDQTENRALFLNHPDTVTQNTSLNLSFVDKYDFMLLN